MRDLQAHSALPNVRCPLSRLAGMNKIEEYGHDERLGIDSGVCENTIGGGFLRVGRAPSLLGLFGRDAKGG